MGVSENVGKTHKPNGFADHYPVFNGYFIGNINPTFSDKPNSVMVEGFQVEVLRGKRSRKQT